MDDIPWALIESGGSRGTGFLVDDRTLLTCAHVVLGPSATVSFRAYGLTMDAAVEIPDSAADVAVLRLKDPVGIPPVLFAPYSALETTTDGVRPVLTAFGHGGPDGMYTSLRVTDLNLDHRGTIQVERASEAASPLIPGFSGAAVCLDRRGVVGMVTQAAPAIGYGRMLPLSSIRRHWPRLDSLVTLPIVGAEGYRRLEHILNGIRTREQPTVMVESLLQQRNDALTARGLRVPSLIAAVEYLVGLVRHANERQAMVYQLLLDVLQSCDNEQRAALAQWMKQYLMPVSELDLRQQGVATAGASVIVRVARSGSGESYNISVARLSPEGATEETDECGSFRKPDVRGAVEASLQAMFRRMETERHRDYLIQFAVPPSWRDELVELWTARYDLDVPLGIANPVTLRDVTRFDNPPTSDKMRWERLLQIRPLKVVWRGCGDPMGPLQLDAWLRAEEPLVVGLAGGEPERVAVPVRHGVPAILWTRQKCDDSAHSHDGVVPCHGGRFRAAAAALFEHSDPDQLPWLVHRLRLQSVANGGSDGPYVALLWDDFVRRPRDEVMGVSPLEAPHA